MKVAITSTGNSPESKIDSHFGRCSFFVVYDTETRAMEFTPNSNKENIEGAGQAALQFITSRGVKKIVSGEFGTKVKSVFDSLKIQLVVLNNSDKTIKDIIDLLNSADQK